MGLSLAGVSSAINRHPDRPPQSRCSRVTASRSGDSRFQLTARPDTEHPYFFNARTHPQMDQSFQRARIVRSINCPKG
jgi:hypothetical protein